MNMRLAITLCVSTLGSYSAFAIPPDTVSPNISAGVMVLKENGEVRTRDINNSEQRPHGIVSQPIPVQITEEPRVKQLTCGASHTVIRRTDHSVGWLGFYDAQESPQEKRNLNEQKDRLRILSNIGNITQIASGDEHTLLLRSDRTVWAYGKGEKGQLGNGKNETSMMPVPVTGLTGVVAIAAGGESSLAIYGDGFVATWGSNKFGQLGDGTTDNHSTPVTITGLTPINAAAMGKDHALAVSKQDGTVRIWGNNKDRQILDSSTAKITVPQKVPQLSGVQAVAAGEGFSLALLNDNTVSIWGALPSGQKSLPDGQNRGPENTFATSMPTRILGLENVVQIAAGSSHALARLQNGTLKAWGLNDLGQLGDGTRNNQHSPVAVKGLEGITDIAVGTKHSCAVRNDYTAWSWGGNPTNIADSSRVPKSHSNRIKRNLDVRDQAKLPLVTFVPAPRTDSQRLALTSGIRSQDSIITHPHSPHGESECMKMSPPVAPSVQ